MAKVFVSYSRKDMEFAKRLTGELQKSELDFWIDWEGIPPTVDWWKEIEKGIEEADAFIFLISPDSIKSKVCEQEVDCAITNGKRLIPLIVRDIPADAAPSKLSHLNWIFFRPGDDFGTGLSKLLTSIHTDYDWVKAHRRLQVKALEWERGNKERSFLLRGKDLQDAEFQLATNTSKEPHPTNLQREYVFASRKATDRQRTITTGIAVAGVIALAALAVFGFVQAGLATSHANLAMTAQSNAEAAQANAEAAQGTAVANEQEAKLQRAQAEAESRRALSGQLALEARSVLDQYPQRAQLLSLEALQTNLEAGEAPRPIAEEALRAANARVTGIGLPGFAKEVSFLQFTRDSQWLVAGSTYSGEFHAWHLDEIDQPGYTPLEINLEASEDDNVQVSFSDQEQWLIIALEKSVWNKVESAYIVEKRETRLYLLGGASRQEPIVFQNPVRVLDENHTVLELQDGKIQFWDLNLETLTAVETYAIDQDFVAFSSNRRILATKSVGPDKAQVTFWEVSKGSPLQRRKQIEVPRGTSDSLFVEASSHRLAIGEVSGNTTTLQLFDMENPEETPHMISLPDASAYYSLQSSPQDSWLKVKLSPGKCFCDNNRSFLIDLQSEEPAIGRYVENSSNEDFVLDGWYVYLDSGYDANHEYFYYYRFVDLHSENFVPVLSHQITHLNTDVEEWRLVTEPDGIWLSLGYSDAINIDALLATEKLVVRPAILPAAQQDTSSSDPWSSIPRIGFEDTVVISATSPNQQWHVEGTYGGSLRLWNLQEESKYQAGQFIGDMSLLRLSSDGQWLTTGSGLWHLQDGLPSGQPINFGSSAQVYASVFSPDGRWLLYNGSGFKLINLESFSKNPSANTLEIDISGVRPYYLSFSTDSRWLMAVGGSISTVLWDLADPQPSPLLLLKANLAEVVFTPDSRHMLGLRTSEDPAGSEVFVWEYPTSQTREVNQIGELKLDQSSQISPNGYWLIAQNSQLWDLRCVIQNTPCEPFSLSIPENSSTRFSPDSLYLISDFVSDQTNKESYQLWSLENASGASRVAPRAIYEAVSGYERTWTTWDIQQPVTGRFYLRGGGGGGGGFGHGSYKVDYGIEVIRSSSGSASFRNLILRGHEEEVDKQLISPTGRFGVTVSADSFKLWDLNAIQTDPSAPALNLPIQTSQIADFGFTMDERFLVVLLYSRELKFLPMRLDDLMTQACRSVGRNFIINEWQRYFPGALYRRTCENLPEHPSVTIGSPAIP